MTPSNTTTETIAEWWKHAPQEEIERLLNLLTEWSQENGFYWNLEKTPDPIRVSFMEAMKQKGFSVISYTTSYFPGQQTIEAVKVVNRRGVKIRVEAQSLEDILEILQ